MTGALVNILVVEDDRVDVMAIRRAFQKRNLQNPIHVARDGLEALSMLASSSVPRPYLVLLDLNMPRMNGIEFLRELRGDARHRDAVVFTLTTSPAEQDRRAAYGENVAGYIEKSDVGKGFAGLVDLLERYWSIVKLP
jgi:CheY-like chemotaxis protein